MSSDINEVIKEDLVGNLSHGMVVCNLTRLVAKKLGLDEDMCNDIAMAGFLHDIGKLKLAQYLYGRDENSLAVEEIKYMRMHSRISFDVLQYYDFSYLTLETVLHHHENFDGSGYPDNLKGEDIPIGARILKVTDTFVALISERPYRKAFTREVAMQIMIDQVKDFDMEVFLAFLEIIHSDATWQMIEDTMHALDDFDINESIAQRENLE